MHSLNKTNMKKLFFLLCFSLALTGFAVARAADSGCSGFEAQFNFLSNGSNVDPTSGLPKVCTAGSAISWITNMALGFAGVIAVVFIIIGGYMYLTSAGNDEAAEKGRKVLTNSIIGLIIIILAATIIRVVVSTLDTKTESVTSTINYGNPTTTPSSTGNGELSTQDLTTLMNGFSVNPTQISFSLSKANEDAIKKACGVQNIGNNVAVSAKVGSKELGRSGLTLQGQEYKGSFSVQSGAFNPDTDTVFVYVCGRIIGPFGG